MLAYQVEVTNGKNIRDMVFFDANTKKILNRYSMVARRPGPRALGAVPPTQRGRSGRRATVPGSLNRIRSTWSSPRGEAYWMFANAFGHDS